MANVKTLARINWPTIMLAGTHSKGPPGYLRALEDEGYSIEKAADVNAARDAMGVVMPHVIVLSRSVPMMDHRQIHEVAAAVGAEVLITPDDAHPELVRVEVDLAMQRALKRRDKR
jgi:hypothetical protein